METDVLNNELIRRLPPAFRQLVHAIETNKTGVTTVDDAPYNGTCQHPTAHRDLPVTRAELYVK